MEGGKEQNYWPGFVDALSNVVLTLVFVLVIFVFALLMASQKVSKKMAEAVQAEAENRKSQTQLDKALAELQQLRSAQGEVSDKAGGAQDACVRFAKSDASQKTNTDSNSILIMFSANAISVTDDTTKIITNFIAQYMDRTHNTNAKFLIEASDDPDSSSPITSRETQLGRLLNIRNTLLSAKVEPRNISIRNIAPQKEQDSYEWVKIHVE